MHRVFIAIFLFLLPYIGISQISATVLYTKCDIHQTYKLYIFTGYDWCANCKRLEKKVLSDSSFIRTMKENGIEIRMIDFPQRIRLEPQVQKYNREIAEKYGFAGIYPTLVLAGGQPDHYKIFFYQNQDSPEYSQLVLENKARLDE